MKSRLADWLDNRTGFRNLVRALLIEEIPGGARWRYVWGSCLALVFLIQLVTGLLLVTAYSPGASTAWASVFFIQYQMDFGWLIRGLHHFGSHAMVVLLCLHMLQVVIAGAHLPPREVNWWLGLLLLAGVLTLSLTGYLLPWDQKGYWATQVATNIVGNLPYVGTTLQKIIVGGPDYGHHTLARFYTVHVALLPPIIIALLIVHVALFRRHGVTVPKNVAGEGWFWPDQAFLDMLAGLAVLALLIGVVLWGHGPAIEPAAGLHVAGADANGSAEPTLWDRIARAGRYGAGANLDAPADPGQPYPARPEWYFMFLFQLLKYFEGDQEIIGTVVIPAAVAGLLFALPLLGYRWMRPIGHALGVLVVVGLFGSMITLTVQAIAEDNPRWSDTEKARLFQAQAEKARQAAKRSIQLADLGIPPEGPLRLLQRDPLTRGEALFGKHCASCHNYGSKFTDGDKASDLKGFGSREWILGLLQDPGHEKYFGNTELYTMIDYVEEELSDLSDPERDELRTVAAWLAGHPRETSDDAGSKPFQQGKTAFLETFECVKCHAYEDHKNRRPGPNFTGYGDADWIRGMLLAPDHASRYGKKNAMPIFMDLEGPDEPIVREMAEERDSALAHLAPVDRELLIRWLTHDPRPVFGGEPIYSP